MATLLPKVLTTLANVKESLGISSADISSDDKLKNIINRVTHWIEGQTRRKLVARNYNGKGTAYTNGSGPSVVSEDYIYLDGQKQVQNEAGQWEIYLPAYPLQRTASNALTFVLATLSDRASTISGGETWNTSELVEWDHYMLDNENGIIRMLGAGRFASGYRNYRVTCTAGFLLPTTTPAAPYVPHDLEGLCIELCKQMFRESRTIASESIGTWSRSYNLTVKDPYLLDVMSKYERPPSIL